MGGLRVIDNGVSLLLLCGLLWFWWNSRGAAETATQVAIKTCEHAGVIFLNDTVAWKKLRLKRNKIGRIQFQRTYFFEFATDMQQRYQGEVIVLGRYVTYINLEVYRIAE